MRRILPSVLYVLLSPFAAILYAQTTCPPKVIEDCPPTGCGSWDKQLDLKKNMEAQLESLKLVKKSPEEIKAMKYPEQWFAGKDRRELKELGEGTAVEVEAYLIAVRYGDATSANCKLTDPKAVNQLLILVSEDALTNRRFGARELTSVTAHLTPRVRLKHSTRKQDKSGREVMITNWTKRKLDALVSAAPQRALKVRISGFLLLDTEHIYNPIRRSTDWEIHPVLGIEVLCATEKKCRNEGEWRNLDTLIIPNPPRRLNTGPLIFDRIP